MSRQTFHPAHWEPIDISTWVEIRERLPKPLTTTEALHDLRHEATLVALGYQRKMAGRTKLRRRWGSDQDHPADPGPKGWSDYDVKRLITNPAMRRRWEPPVSPGGRPAPTEAPPKQPKAGSGRAAPRTETGWDDD